MYETVGALRVLPAGFDSTTNVSADWAKALRPQSLTFSTERDKYV